MRRLSVEYIKEKCNHAGFQRYFQNISWMLFARIATMVVSFVTTAYIARNIGPTNYGELSYAVSYVGLFSFIAAFGIDQILYRELIRYPEKRNEYLGTALILRFITSIFATIICILIAFIWSSKDVSLFLIFVVSLTLILSSISLISYEFMAGVKSRNPSLLALVVMVILNILKIIVVANNEGVLYLAGIIVLEPILYAIGYIYMRHREYGVIHWIFNTSIARSLVKDAFPLIFASAFFSIYARIDQVMIKNMLNAESVGLYDAAVRISEIWYFIPQIIITALFPAVLNAKKVSDELYFKRTKKLFLLVFGISILTALPTALFSKSLILLVFGTGFIGAVNVLQIYVWSNIGGALNSLAHQILIAENLTKIVSVTAFLGMTTNVILNIILIPRMGIAGAATASLISYFIPFASLLLFKKTRKIIINLF